MWTNRFYPVVGGMLQLLQACKLNTPGAFVNTRGASFARQGAGYECHITIDFGHSLSQRIDVIYFKINDPRLDGLLVRSTFHFLQET